ncbi:hypothetical protein CHS0354_041963 [Potamilus streckersoni]|uniref:PIH1D1/2/3 CS-like domain-containing protein n=1 Tax=Potamilus streckersoni TaxID=2493646 RepID=A0AAE0W8T7_9BIVA|nr:hypothetical protein CHS0354_041963 [Potamilus streckersoni]
MDFLSGASITAIADLLKPPEDEDSDYEDTKPSIAKFGPGNIGPSKTEASSELKKESSAQKNSKDIWDEEEVPEGAEYESTYDPRPQPEYDIVYKQAVTTEDIYLQMGNKTPTTASCEEMVVKIKLPDTKLADVELDGSQYFIYGMIMFCTKNN